ncbi:hypothetical protein BBP40_004948 [Aspergillus hancockii]|nr:hypothetical protein BBP40_004948 [Aspergillus hancockii]
MNQDPGVQFVAARPRKRNHQQMSQSSQSPSRRSFPRNGEPSSSRAPPTQHPPLPPMRYPGDGFDFRRPVASASPQTEEVIDLTNEPDSPPQQNTTRATQRRPRQPRFGREIMADVVDLEEEPDNTIQLDPSSSPEVQFVGASVRPILPRPTLPPPPPLRDRGFMGSSLLQMLRFGGSRGRALSDEELLSRGLAWGYRGGHRHHLEDVETFWIGDGPGGAIDLTINLDMDGPVPLDYEYPGRTPDRGSRQTYKPPTPPPEGFTRSLGEDDVVCCPNCDAELGTGDETQQQIWVVKQCGHVRISMKTLVLVGSNFASQVYCGQCATHRSKSNAKKASQPTRPFSKCQVADCGKAVSAPKSMFQVYL